MNRQDAKNAKEEKITHHAQEMNRQDAKNAKEEKIKRKIIFIFYFAFLGGSFLLSAIDT
jgi:hypothetical protein